MKRFLSSLIILSIAISMHAQFKMDFSYMGPLYNSWEFGVALKNYLGEEKFNDFLKSGLAMDVCVTHDAHGLVNNVTINYMREKGMSYRHIPDEQIRVIDIETFKKHLKERKYSFSATPVLIGKEEDIIAAHILLYYLPYTVTRFYFPLEAISIALMYSKPYDTYETFNSQPELLSKNFYTIPDSSGLNQLIPLTADINQLYNSTLAFLGIYDFLGNAALNWIMRLPNTVDTDTISFKVFLDSNGFPIKIKFIKASEIWLNLKEEQDIFEERLLYFYQNHHLKFRLEKGAENNELIVSFPGDILTLWKLDTNKSLSFNNFAFQFCEYFRNLKFD